MIDLLGILPRFLWFGLILFLLWRYRRQIEGLFRRLSTFKGMGVELGFAAASMDDAVAARAHFLEAEVVKHGSKADPAHRIEVPEEDRERALIRARANLDLLAGRRVLWVDDVPTNNRSERRLFRSLGVTSEAVVSTDEALGRLERDESQFDLIISDMARDDDGEAGLKCLRQYEALTNGQGRAPDDRLPVIFYLGKYDPGAGTPAGAFGITNRPDQLVHLAIDALEQTKH